MVRKKTSRRTLRLAENYHITITGKKTTFSLDIYLSDLLAIALNEEPNTSEANTAIRVYISDIILKEKNPSKYLSLQARRIAIETIAKPKIVERYYKYQGRDEKSKRLHLKNNRRR